MRSNTRLLACAGTLLALLALPAVAPAALPQTNTQYGVHDHTGEGTDFHIEIEVGKNPRQLKSVVLYLEQCDATAFAEKVPVSETGAFEVVASLPKGGTWRVTGTFPTADHAHGDYELTNAKCTTGAKAFDAHPPTADGGHAGHSSSSHHRGGTAPDRYATLTNKSRWEVAEAARLWSRTLTVAQTRPFRTYRNVRRLYEITAARRPRPLIFHVHRKAYDRDRYVLAATRPESLVYWWPRKGDPILVAFMYRANTLIPPKFAGGIFGWHAHAAKAMPMTHVWLTKDLRSAAANCMPVPELERDVPRYKWSTPAMPCCSTRSRSSCRPR